ncbi:MAG: carbohydrate kinase family protein [Candidatus Sungiibacteriota bacterium]|uniref:Carbohydrate kinase family protein n=1 Tax=Candidatus Sungiibacteriota bacterium TaxID=2750080 RepID=A0A7T5RJM4_9BACT|nr:MAG: carbohydrate kinase family protein [Candidatus Sungbacteria bacterium]
MIYDFIAIGDTATDAFIRLKDASVHCDIDRERCVICMRFKDKIPYEAVYVVPAVGNSANASVAASRLGLKSALVSNIGDDYFGQECLDALKKEKVDTEFIKIHKDQKTNYHYVLWYEDDRTILIKHEEFEYSLPEIDKPKWVYFSSLAGNSLPFHKIVEKYLYDHPSIKLAFQPGTFQIKAGKDVLKKIYERSDVFLCNKEEAQRILGTDEKEIKKLLQMMHKLGPKIVVITDGPAGAYASDGQNAWSMRSYPDPKPPYERTGAGDAFSSTFVVALCLGLDVPEALRWAPINSMSVVQYVGAREGLLSRKKLEEYLAEAPADYFPKKI